MATKSIESFYEKIVPFKISYFIFYPVFFNVVLAIYKILLDLHVFKDTNSFTNQFLNTQLLSSTPVIFIFLHHQFKEIVFPSVKYIFEDEENDVISQESVPGEDSLIDTLLEKVNRQTFIINRQNLIYILSITFLGSSTVYLLDIPTIENSVVKIIVFGVLAVLILFGSHLSYVMLSLLYFLNKITDRLPRKSFPFYRLPHPSITKLQNYYLMAALMLTVAWICFAIATWNSPYGIDNSRKAIEPAMIYWLIISGSGPLLMFLWTSFCIHKIIYNIKQLYIQKISASIQGALDETLDEQKGFESLKNHLELQDKIQNIKEWPINFANVSTFIVTLGTFLGALAKPEVMSLIKNLWKTSW